LQSAAKTGKRRPGKPSTFLNHLMQLRHFVTCSAVILCAWLALTFVTEVPTQSYPKLEKYVRKGGLKPLGDDTQLASSDPESEISRVSASQ